MAVADTIALFVIREPGVPLEVWDDGSVRVGGTRLLLDTVVDGFNVGRSAEKLAEVHGGLPAQVIRDVIDYYLRHRDEVNAYVRDGEKTADEAYDKIMALPGQAEAVERMRSRMEEERMRRAERDARRTD